MLIHAFALLIELKNIIPLGFCISAKYLSVLNWAAQTLSIMQLLVA